VLVAAPRRNELGLV